MKLEGRLVVVTGASSGLGRAIAWRLAVEEQADVLLAARRRDRLEELQADIAAAGRGRAWLCEVDLSAPEGPRRLIDRARDVARARAQTTANTDARTADPPAGTVFGLVNNAGVTHYGPVATMTPSELSRVLHLNVVATMELTRLFLELHAALNGSVPHDGVPLAGGTAGRTRARAREPEAAVLTVTSIAAFLPVPYQSVYAASKHALQAFSESLWFELHRTARRGGPRIVTTAFAPGGIATEMIERSGLSERFSLHEQRRSAFLAPADRVARAAVRAWKRERRARVGGIANTITVVAARFLPRRIVGWMAERLYRP